LPFNHARVLKHHKRTSNSLGLLTAALVDLERKAAAAVHLKPADLQALRASIVLWEPVLHMNHGLEPELEAFVGQVARLCRALDSAARQHIRFPVLVIARGDLPGAMDDLAAAIRLLTSRIGRR
jgi:hypothetical protein